MKVVVIGLGSMGKRRIRLIKKIDELITIVGVDGNTERCKEAAILYGVETFSSISEASTIDGITCAFVCTSPLSHANIIEECLKNSWNVFTELNLVADKYAENIKLAKENNCTLFLSSTFFYREEITYIRKQIKNKSKTVKINQVTPRICLNMRDNKINMALKWKTLQDSKCSIRLHVLTGLSKSTC